MEKAFTGGDNSGMTATDTVKNNCYKVAKALAGPTGADALAVALAEHFVKTYPLVSAHLPHRRVVRTPQEAVLQEVVGGITSHGGERSPKHATGLSSPSPPPVADVAACTGRR